MSSGQARTFANAMKKGSIGSKSDIYKPLKSASKYPDLNIESITMIHNDATLNRKPTLKIN